MQKKLVLLALAGLSFNAAADVTLYGRVKSSVSTGQVKISGDSGVEKSATATKINDNTSRLGFRGKEKLSDDLSAIWQVESRVSVLGDKPNDTFGNRDSFIGVEGKYGKLRAGNLNNMLNEMDTIDNWMWSNSALGLSAYTRTGARMHRFAMTARKLPAGS